MKTSSTVMLRTLDQRIVTESQPRVWYAGNGGRETKLTLDQVLSEQLSH